MADSTYNGLFFRAQLGQANTLPKAGAQSQSPDIIPYGTVPTTDPTNTFTDYGKDYGQQLTANTANYIYLRAKNYATTTLSETPRLFYTKSSVLSYPSSWTELTQVGKGPVSQFPPTLAAAANDVAIQQDPFLWVPENTESGWHYCMIGLVNSPGYNADAVLKMLTVSDLAGYVAQNGGAAWRNVSVINTSQAAQQFSAYNQGAQAGTMWANMVCKGVPKDSVISFSGGTPGTNPAFYLEPTTVSTYPNFTAGITVTVPANWQSNVVMTVTPPSGGNLDNASVSLVVAFQPNQETKLWSMGRTPGELGIPHPDIAKNMILRQLYYDNQPLVLQPHHEQYLEQLVRLDAAATQSGPVRLIVVGQDNRNIID